jgi:DNA polymerase III epsilon subunit-like protein
MAYLILDTETNGLNNLTDHVIEVGAVIAQFNQDTRRLEYIDSYQSLVFLETFLDEKITELTGITVDLLKTAPKRHVVQEEWMEFLKKYEITHILGHSLGFDTGFLKSNGFYLPDAYEFDTLDLAKILLPDTKAVNLDYINATYQLDKHFPLPESLKDLQHHRALFDAFIAAALYNFLMIRVEESNVSTDFVFGLEHFLKQKINVVEHIGPYTPIHLQEVYQINALKQDIDESSAKTFEALLEDENVIPIVNNLFNTIKDKENTTYIKIILSIWYGLLNTTRLGKIMLNGSLEKKFYELVMTSLGKSELKFNDDYNLYRPEQLIGENKDLTTMNVSTLDILDYLELYHSLRTPIKEEIDNVRLEQSKLLASIRTITKTSYYGLNRANLAVEQTDLVNALESFKRTLKSIVTNHEIKYTRTALEDKIIKYLKQCIINIDAQDLSFFFHDNDVKIYVANDFNLRDYLINLLNDSKQTYTTLTAPEYLKFIELFDLKGQENIAYGPDLIVPKTTNIIDDLKADNAHCKIVFIGKTSNLKTFPIKLKAAGLEYMDLSNAGSATKILSKIENGYNGIAIMSYKNIEFLSNFLHDKSEHLEFYFYGDIFLPLTSSIKNLNTKGANQFEFDKQASKLYLKFLLHKLHIKFSKKTGFYSEI